MNYGQILGRALTISWRHKYLWLLAILAGEGAAGSVGSSGSGTSQRRPLNSAGVQTDWNSFVSWIGAHATLLWTVGLTIFAIAIVLFVISAIANGALVRGAAEHDAERPFGLGQAWSTGLHTFWPVFELKLFALVIGLGAAVILGGLAVLTFVSAFSGAAAAAIIFGVLTAVAVVLAVPTLIVFEVAIRLGIRAIVLEGKGMGDGFRSALHLLMRRKGRVALMWLLIWVISAVGAFAVGVVVVLVALPLVAVGVASYFAGGWVAATISGIVLGTIWLAVVLTVSGALSAYVSTAWTLAYRRFDLEAQPAMKAQPLPAS